jgi:hypothetical protein
MSRYPILALNGSTDGESGQRRRESVVQARPLIRLQVDRGFDAPGSGCDAMTSASLSDRNAFCIALQLRSVVCASLDFITVQNEPCTARLGGSTCELPWFAHSSASRFRPSP